MSTLIRPPPNDPAKSTIENLNELTRLSDIDPDLFTNTRPLWHPPGARGVYGGAVIAHCLVAAQRTVPDDFLIHSMHCYFVLAGNPDIPVMYHVERVREGRSFATRTVQARQRGKVIFTTTLSFAKDGSGGKLKVEHGAEMPSVPQPTADVVNENLFGETRPFMNQFLKTENDEDKPPTKKIRSWVKARDSVSEKGGHRAHESALAYVSDSYFIGAISRAHKLWRWQPEAIEKIRARMNDGALERILAKSSEDIQLAQGMLDMEITALRCGYEGLSQEDRERQTVGMMVSLDHTIYFHNPKSIKVDDWMFSEMETPWAGDGRGLVHQKIWARDGTLLATCVQEGVIRLKQPKEAKL